MKTAFQENEADDGLRAKVSGRNAGMPRGLVGLLLMGLAALPFVSTVGLDAGVAKPRKDAGGRICRKVVLRGEVAAGQEWRAPIGEGWVFRVLPIADSPVRSIKSATSGGNMPKNAGYTGWDLVVDRENGAGYPDALLLATPPYGSVNEREIGTTFGMRAQDAIAWEPRKFHFLTNFKTVEQARPLFEQLFTGAPMNTGGRLSSEANSKRNAAATRELLDLISNNPEMGYGKFSITDARLIAGVGDPPPFAQAWSAHLGQVPHTLEQAFSQGTRSVGTGAATAHSKAGELRWIQFVATLWFPENWKAPPGSGSEAANCAE